MILKHKQKLKRRQKQFGFSLLEIILSIVMLTILSVGLMSSLSYMKRGTMNTEDAFLAKMIVDRKMVELKDDFMHGVTIVSGVSSSDISDELRTTKSKVPTLTVDSAEQGTGTGLYKVTVTLNWTDPQGQSHTYPMTSYFFKE